MINIEEDEVKVDLDKLGAALEVAMTFLGNVYTQTTNLRRQRIMEDINKDLVPYTMEQETHFTAQAPMLFGPEFMKKLLNTGIRSRYSREACSFGFLEGTIPPCAEGTKMGWKTHNIVLL